MVSQGNISRKNRIIFVTVGTSKFPFNRLLGAIDHLQKKHYSHQFIIQSGVSQYVFKNKKLKFQHFIRPDVFIKLLQNADKIITHCAAGTLHEIAKYSKVMPLIIPRHRKFHEHVDNHQVYLAEYLSKQFPDQYLNNVCTDNDLTDILEKYISYPAKKNILGKYFTIKQNQKLNAFIKRLI